VYREKPEWAENEAEESVEITGEEASSVLRSGHAYIGGDSGDFCMLLMDVQARTFDNSSQAPSSYFSYPSYDNREALEYKKVNFDLNKGAGGKYIYFYAGFGKKLKSDVDNFKVKALRDICFYKAKKSGDYTSAVISGMVSANSGYRFNYFKIGTDGNPNASGYKGTGRQVDLNEGAGGRYIYTFGSTEYVLRDYIVGIGVSNRKSSFSGYRLIRVDLNDGAGGNYVYAHVKHRK
jgi:hypothetical protein